jgi:predicted Zn finger-like uncharacterized protein
MILTCPSCGTQYVVKDGAIPPGGRQVRCASCKHSWHEDADGVGDPETSHAQAPAEPDASPEPAPDLDQAPGDEDESIAEALLIDPRSGPEAEERAYEEAMVETKTQSAEAEPVHEDRAAASDWREPPAAEVQDDEFSPFPTADGESALRRRSPLLVTLLVIVAVAAIAAAFWFFAPPEWKVRLGIVAAGASPLALVTTHMDRQRLESGNELLTVTGRVINPTAKEQDVPPLQAQLRSRSGQIVYKWTIAPPARSLPPGGSASFNSAEVNVPPGGDELTITVGPPNA